VYGNTAKSDKGTKSLNSTYETFNKNTFNKNTFNTLNNNTFKYIHTFNKNIFNNNTFNKNTDAFNKDRIRHVGGVKMHDVRNFSFRIAAQN